MLGLLVPSRLLRHSVTAVSGTASAAETVPDTYPVPVTASPEAVAVLVENHRRFLAFLERRVESRDVAEDILQDALVRAISRAGQLRDRDSVVAWFYRALRNALADHWRSRGSERRIFDASVTPEDAEPAADPELMQTVCECALSLLDTIKPEYAEALKRIELDGVSVQDYASEKGVTPNNASVRLFRARKALKNRVVACCGSCAEHGCVDCSCSSNR